MNINKKILSWSLILSLISAYILPGRLVNGGRFAYGYPLGFFEISNKALNTGRIIMSTTNLNLLSFAVNTLLIYFVINFLYRRKLSKTI